MSEQVTPALRYLNLVRDKIAGIRADVPCLTELGERMAAPLLAGGLMALKRRVLTGRNDVAYFALPNPKRWDAKNDETLKQLMEGESQLFVIGRPEDLKGVNIDRFAGFTGGSSPDEGLYGTESTRPLATTREFEQFVRGWITAGEMIGASTRAGKMPVVYMSVWMEGGRARNLAMTKHNNFREPWEPELFHDDYYVPPVAAGYPANAFLDEIEKIHRTLVEQAQRLATAGQWLAEAKREKRRTWIVAVGHSYPAVLEIPEGADYPVRWGPTISDLRRAMSGDMSEGDVALHLGYSPVDVGDVQAILDRGIRFIYTSPYGRPAALKDHPNLLWLDLPWRPGDATVDIPGYSARILPASSSAHTMTYFAILSEMAERMGWK
jgi:hypothetical protein